MVARISKSNKATTMKSILTRLHLQQYLPTFQKHDIDITIFLTLNEQTLKIIGIKNESHRKILIIWIKKLQQLLLTSTNNNNDISTLTINTKKILSEINNDDKDYDEEGGGEEEEEDDDDYDDDDQIIIDEQLILETVQNNNKKLLTPITEEDSDGSSFFFNNNNNNNNNNNSDDDDDGDDGGDGGGGKSDVGIILNSATTQVTDYNTVPIPEYSEIDLINSHHNNDENHDDINEINVIDNSAHYFYHNPQSNTSSSTLATSASITTLPSYTPFTTSTLLRTLSRNSSKSSKSSRLTKLSLSSRIFNGGPTIVESEDSNNNNDNNNSSSNNNNNMIVNNINNRSKNKIKHQSVLNPKNWRHSMSLIPSISSLLPSSPLSSAQSSSPPSYFNIVVDDYNDKKSDHHIANSLATNDKSKYNVDCDKEGNELLPEYSCTVNHSGFVLIKKEFTRKGIKATKRSWQKRYLYLWGTFLCIYPNEPENINVAKPLNRFSMQDAQVELAIDYPKRKYVLRIKFKTGHQYLIQADDKEECVSWIERLQSSCNISSTIDERQMPMFITLPTRRRNNGGNISSGVDVTNIIHNDGYDNYSTSLATTSLTYQRFNEIAREIQQVQITNSSINYQLSW